MKKFIQWFFIIGSFVFLYWYMPEALRDNKVTLVEMATIGINVLCFIINFVGFIESVFSGIVAEGYEDADGFHYGKKE